MTDVLCYFIGVVGVDVVVGGGSVWCFKLNLLFEFGIVLG
jgi:hypothetical protein